MKPYPERNLRCKFFVYRLNNRPGRRFVDIYYKRSPAAAEVIAERPVLRLAVAAGLAPVALAALSLTC